MRNLENSICEKRMIRREGGEGGGEKRRRNKRRGGERGRECARERGGV